MKNSLFIFVCVLFLYFSHAFTQTVTPQSPLVFNVDYSRYRYSLDSGCLELSFAAYPSYVTLENARDTLKGSVVFQVLILDEQTDSLVVRSAITLSMILGDTTATSLNTSYLGKTTYVLPFGSYELIVHGFDARNPARQDSVHKRFAIGRYDHSSMISDVDLCSQIVQTQDKSNPFYKNSYEVLVNPSLVFGTATKPVVFAYAEFYNLRIDTPYSITTQIVDAQNTVLKQRIRMKRFNIKNAVDVTTLNISSLPSGKYKFQVLLSDTLGKNFSRSEKPVFINNPNVQPSSAVNISAKSVEFAGMSNDELLEEFEKIRYLIIHEDKRTFEKLTTTDARREFLATFWTDVEHGKRGRSDITRMLYHQRIMVANQRYRSMGRDGWLSDRGRIYILYAEPDEIQRFPNSENSKPYEIWNYYQIENGIMFVFIDNAGFGEYRLVHSTKRGELQDESWERYLR